MAAVTTQPGVKYLNEGFVENRMVGYADSPAFAGLDYLRAVDQFVIKQKIELVEILCGCEMNNKYSIMNTMGQQVFFAQEETGFCMRYWCGPARGFTIHITDNNGQEVIRLVRKFKCCAGCCWCANQDCCAFELQIEAPPGNLIGYVRQEQSKWKPVLTIRSVEYGVIGHILGPCCPCSGPCCKEVEFPVYAQDMSDTIGKVYKQWTGLFKEGFTDADTFGVTFPMDLELKTKALMLGAVFLVDFMYFERQQQR